MKLLPPLLVLALLAGCAHSENSETASTSRAKSPTSAPSAASPVAVKADAPNRVLRPVNPHVALRVDAALPAKAKASPKKPRLVLVTARTEGFYHESIPTALYALTKLGEKTGAFKVEVDNEMSAFTAENLARFDAVIFANTTQLKFNNPAHRAALLEFVREKGKGVIGIHAASDNFPEWPEGQALMGGVFHSHPWLFNATVAIKLDEPEHPLNAAFGGKGFWITEEMYQIVGPYSRDTHRVLTSLDMSKKQNDRPEKALVRKDRDFPVAWLKNEGKGRVFYSSLGHNDSTFYSAEVLEQYLDGIQFALGDLSAPAEPSSTLKPAPKPALAPDTARTLLQSSAFLSIQDSDTTKEIAGLAGALDSARVRSVEEALRLANGNERSQFLKDLRESARGELNTSTRKTYARWFAAYGGSDEVPLLSAWARINDSSDDAIRALAAIEDDSAEKALLELLTGPQSHNPVAVANALGERRSKAAVEPLSVMLSASMGENSVAAMHALSHIGTEKALDALTKYNAPQALQSERAWAIVHTAAVAGDASEGKRADAAREILNLAIEPTLKVAAAHALIQIRGKDGLVETLPHFRNTAVGMLLTTEWIYAAVSLDADRAIKSLAEEFPKLDPQLQVAFIGLADQIAKPIMLPLVEAGLASSTPELRTASLLALGTVGDDDDAAKRLFEALENSEDRATAITALSRLKLKSLDEDVRDRIKDNTPAALKAAYLTIASNRVDSAVMPAILEGARSEVPEVRQASYRAMKNLVRGEDLALLLDLRSQLKTNAERRAWQDAVVSAIGFRSDVDAVVTLIQQQLGGAKGTERNTFIIALNNLDTEPARQTIWELLGSDSVESRKEVIRALAMANNVQALQYLIVAAEKATDPSERILALRPVLDILRANGEYDQMKKVNLYGRAWTIAEREEEQEAIAIAAKGLWSEDGKKLSAQIDETRAKNKK